MEWTQTQTQAQNSHSFDEWLWEKKKVHKDFITPLSRHHVQHIELEFQMHLRTFINLFYNIRLT